MMKTLEESGRITWATHVQNMLFRYGFGYVWISHDVGDIHYFIKVFKQRLIDCFSQNWDESVQE